MWPLPSLKVRKPFFTLTLPGDLAFDDLGLKFLHHVSYSIFSRYWKNGGVARRPFSTIREKPERRADFAPPPSSARVKPCICRVASRVTRDSLAGSVFEEKFWPMIPCAVKAHHMVTLKKKCKGVRITYCGGVSHKTSNADSRHVCTRFNFFSDWI